MRSAATFVLVLALHPWAYGCSYPSSWQPPSVQRAFETAQVVVHARVVSGASGADNGRPTVTIFPIKVLKGTFAGGTVENQPSSMCGANLKDGEEYVFFFPKGAGYSVTTSSQPTGTTTDILSMLPRNASGSLVQEPQRPSGNYFQMGLRWPVRPTTNDPEPIVNLQIDLGSRELCESRLAVLPRDRDAPGESAWCSPLSASARLKFYGVLKSNRSDKPLRVETETLEECELIAQQASTAGADPNKCRPK
jgi:hypothetical protein